MAQLQFLQVPSCSSSSPAALCNGATTLNCLSQGSTKVDALGQAAVETALHNARVAMLAPAWQPEWGGRAAQEALRAGAISDAGKAADIYRAVNPRCPSVAEG
jgi:hypothetical protein